MSSAAWNPRWDRVQAAKDSLGIEAPVEVFVGDFEELAYVWFDVPFDGAHKLYVNRALHHEFASFCLWHELAHIRQAEQDYGLDTEAYLWDYQEVMLLHPGLVIEDGFVLHDSHTALRWAALVPWEAEANLTAWENRMVKLTRRGKGPHTHGPQGTYWFFRDTHLDLHETIEVGNQYRHEMRRAV